MPPSSFRSAFLCTVLHYSAIKGDAPMATLLLSRGAKADSVDVWGFSPAQVSVNLNPAKLQQWGSLSSHRAG